MKIQRYAKKEIALQQLETALELYFLKRDLFSVVTLAGAAEEILGQLLPQDSSGDAIFRSVLAILRPAARRTEVAQGGAAGEDADYIHMDLEQEARFLLGRGIDDYQALGGSLTPAMSRFNVEVRGKE